MSNHDFPPVKPSAITTVQVIAWVKAGLIGLGTCLILIGTSMVSGSAANGDVPAAAMGLLVLMLVILAALAICYVVIAINIAEGRNWARIMAIVIEVINLASAPFLLLGSDMVNPAPSVIGLVLSIIVIVFAAKPEAREYCRRMSA